MWTVLAIDDEIVEKIKAKVRKTGRPFKDVLNDTLRAELALESPIKKLAPFKIEQQHFIRLKPGPNYDKVEEIFGELDTQAPLR